MLKVMYQLVNYVKGFTQVLPLITCPHSMHTTGGYINMDSISALSVRATHRYTEYAKLLYCSYKVY